MLSGFRPDVHNFEEAFLCMYSEKQRLFLLYTSRNLVPDLHLLCKFSDYFSSLPELLFLIIISSMYKSSVFFLACVNSVFSIILFLLEVLIIEMRTSFIHSFMILLFLYFVNYIFIKFGFSEVCTSS